MTTDKKIDLAFDDDVTKQLNACGFPTFDEFVKNPEILLGREDDRLTEVDKGSTNLNRVAKKYIYEIEGHKCKTLHEVERVAKNMGINMKELDYRPVVHPNTSGSYDLKVTFISKSDMDKRNK